MTTHPVTKVIRQLCDIDEPSQKLGNRVLELCGWRWRVWTDETSMYDPAGRYSPGSDCYETECRALIPPEQHLLGLAMQDALDDGEDWDGEPLCWSDWLDRMGGRWIDPTDFAYLEETYDLLVPGGIELTLVHRPQNYRGYSVTISYPKGYEGERHPTFTMAARTLPAALCGVIVYHYGLELEHAQTVEGAADDSNVQEIGNA